MNKSSLVGLCSAVTLGVATFAASSSGAVASGTVHTVTPASKSNYSSAAERPTWGFSCNSATKKWTFSINDVQVIDVSHRPWLQNHTRTGPWWIGFFAGATAGPVPFSGSAKLHQNATNGLFTAEVSGSASNAATWCTTGTGFSVVGFSGGDEPLLLDGTLG